MRGRSIRAPVDRSAHGAEVASSTAPWRLGVSDQLRMLSSSQSLSSSSGNTANMGSASAIGGASIGTSPGSGRDRGSVGSFRGGDHGTIKGHTNSCMVQKVWCAILKQELAPKHLGAIMWKLLLGGSIEAMREHWSLR